MLSPHLPLTALGLASALVLTGCASALGDNTEQLTASPTTEPAEAESQSLEADSAETVDISTWQDYLGDYELIDDARGTITTVTVSNGTREIVTNALPNHDTGEFPNPGNPNAISAQDNTWSFPVEPVFTGNAESVKVTGVGLNGIKFDPGTGERVTCSSGEVYNLEALQDVSDLGLDFNNAHVQPNGEYHYHGVSELLVDLYDVGEDLVLVGFAADGHLMYYSKSGQYESSYQISAGTRAGDDCVYQAPLGGDPLDFGSEKDGSLTQDWEYSAGLGDLDQCNGTIINGEYAYLLTDTYPYVPRCLNGEFEETMEQPMGMNQPPSNQPMPGSGEMPNGPPPMDGDRPMPPPGDDGPPPPPQ